MIGVTRDPPNDNGWWVGHISTTNVSSVVPTANLHQLCCWTLHIMANLRYLQKTPWRSCWLYMHISIYGIYRHMYIYIHMWQKWASTHIYIHNGYMCILLHCSTISDIYNYIFIDISIYIYIHIFIFIYLSIHLSLHLYIYVHRNPQIQYLPLLCIIWLLCVSNTSITLV